jgi:uncharacterized membrane protein YphA (DoxX/SURF4 family)
MLKKNIVDSIAVLFIILFLYTGISKLIDFTVFKEQIATSSLLAPVAAFITFMVPATEFLVALMLAIPRWRLKGLYASTALMVSFTIYIIGVLLFNKEIPCSCGGVIEALSWNQHIAFNALFIALGFGGLIIEKKLRHENKCVLGLIAQ